MTAPLSYLERKLGASSSQDALATSQNEIQNGSSMQRTGGLPHIKYGLPISQEQEPDRLLRQVQSNFQYLQKRLSTATSQIQQSVMIDSRVMHGNPTFVGTRVPLYRIVEELADGTTLDEVVEAYPSVTLEQVQAGLDFAASLLRIYDD